MSHISAKINLDRPPPPGLPFFKLPPEIRTRIYDDYFGHKQVIIKRKYTGWAPRCTNNTCSLSGKADFRYAIDIALVRTSSRVRDEALPVFYSSRTPSFKCTCTMASLILNNSLAAANIRSLRFYWAGPASDVHIPSLYQCPELKSLTIFVSKATTYYPTKRETEMQTFWKSNTTRLSDARGIDELMRVRGLESVDVNNAPLRSSVKRTDEEVWGLERLLVSVVLLEKPDGYGQTGGSS
jgi:hypothetical protein